MSAHADALRGSAEALGLFAASRLVILATAHIGRTIDASRPIRNQLLGWDGGWYLNAAANGYPTSVPDAYSPASQTTLAFFPGLPSAIRAVSALTGLRQDHAALLLVHVAGAATAIALWHLARHLTNRRIATRTVALFVFFPYSFVLSMIYPEALLCGLAAGSLLFLLRQQWVAAGLLAGLASGVRVHGLALAVACAVAAYPAVRDRREWRALAAPILAPLGFLVWSAYLWSHTGSPTTWLDAQSHGWGNDATFEAEFFRRLQMLFSSVAIHDLNVLVWGLFVIGLVAGALALWYWRPPAVLTAYSIAVLVPTIASSATIARYLMVVLPFYIAWARRMTDAAFAGILAVSAGLMAALYLVVALTGHLTP